MTFDFSNVNFLPDKNGNGFDPLQQLSILSNMQTAYRFSDTARKMFNNWNKTINVYYKKGALGSNSGQELGLAGTGNIYIDLAELDDLTYINDHGKAVPASLLGTITHELGHALTGRTDNISVTNYQGQNVEFTNKIWAEIEDLQFFGLKRFNLLDKQISYTASAYSSLQKGGYDYTNNTEIDAAYNVEYERAADLPPVIKNTTNTYGITKVNALFTRGTGLTEDDATSTRLGKSRDLLIGGFASNKLYSGAGNDFLFGGGGNDLLNGGADTDTAVYYGPSRDYQYYQNKDGVSWTVKNIGDEGAGTDKLINIEKIQFDGDILNIGHKTLTLNRNGTVSQKNIAKNIAFVFDTTENLDPSTFIEFSSLDTSKLLALSVLDDLFADPDNDVEIGIVGFNDTTIGNFSQVALQFTDQEDFADRKAAAIAAIDSLILTYGGDIPETPFDGLRLALDGSLGQWRLDGGTHQIFLFTDSPAKDYVLADYVTALAHNVGATIASTAIATLAGGAVNTFNLVGSSLTATTQVQIYTVFTGAAGTDTAALASIANNNGGTLITAPNTDDLLNQILEIINAPPVSQTPTNDFNGDGNSDILWRNTNGSIALWSLDGTIVTPKSLGSLSSDWTIAGTGDFNGDFTNDILWRNADGTVVTWQLNDSTVTTSTVLATVSADWKIAGTGDFNGDSESDILWRNDNGAVVLWNINDSAITAGVYLPTVSTDWKIAGTADFNGDGESDILWRNDNGAVVLWTINDSAYSGGGLISNVSNDWKIEGTGDFNGDLNADILWRNDNGTVVLWQMDGTTITNGAVISTVANDWKIAGTGDFNYDGKSDILWRNDLGSVSTWQMNGSTVVSASLTSIPAVDPTWKIAAPIL
jgi:FG-GAP-like repeat/RTX calcium-binding nonapeptide repeat (4 copies)